MKAKLLLSNFRRSLRVAHECARAEAVKASTFAAQVAEWAKATEARHALLAQSMDALKATL